MNIKHRKLVLHFLQRFEGIMHKEGLVKLNPFFKDLFSREELLEMHTFLSEDRNMSFPQTQTLENNILLDLIKEDSNILSFLIHRVEQGIVSAPTLKDDEKREFFERVENELHYLYEKPCQEWDGYDRSNYYALLFKHGVTKRVFAIFTTDVGDNEKYAVTTKPSYYFDTEDEAKAELENILDEGKFQRDELKIMSLWNIK